MSEKVVVPPEMLEAVNGTKLWQCPRENKEVLEAALLWLDGELSESNVAFHRAILEAEAKRIPGDGNNFSVIARRVDFEYGVSFARNYVRRMFLAPEPEVPEAIKDAAAWCEVYFGDHPQLPALKDTMVAIYRRGLKEGKP